MTNRHQQDKPKHFDPWGYFFNDYGDLIGHDSIDVKRWVDAHPSYSGSIWFDYGTDEKQVDVRGEFYPDPDEDTTPVCTGERRAAA